MEASSSSSEESYHLCETCKSYLKGEKKQQPSTTSSQGISNNNESSSSSKRGDDDPSSSSSKQSSQSQSSSHNDVVICSCCMGLWSFTVKSQLKESISKACQPYGGLNNNRFATQKFNNHQAPTISIAADVHIRYNYFLLLLNDKTTTKTSLTSCIPVHIFIHDLKQYLLKCVNEIIIEAANYNQESTSSSAPTILQTTDDNNEVIIQNNEEQGYMSLHILIIPPKDMQPTLLMDNPKTKRKRRRGRYRPFQTQGGDPRTNLELRLQSKGYDWIPLSQVVVSKLDDIPNINVAHNNNNTSSMMEMEIHVAAFRRPIFLYGYYTKSRRDVSQTPFVVPSSNNNDNNDNSNKKSRRTADDGEEDNDDDDEMGTKDDNDNDDGGDDTDNKATATKETTTNTTSNDKNKNSTTTLGVTSVEEQICQPIIDLLGISTQNNDSGERSNVIYGSCKFHASGREDMDVRMLLRPTQTKGRPFCVQLIDALRPIQSQDQLINLIHTINHTTNKTAAAAGNHDDDDKNNQALSSPMWYGCNPMGVGISDDFKLVPSKVFSNLQSDTETKIKHYGCYCWSSKELPVIDKNEKCSLNDYFFANTTFPLTIQQRTPIRVLHRRTNIIRERQIYSANATRIDNHHFRLELSTQAGTYIKEFVHGDLLRTKPSMATILNCKTNLLQLDCEGIDI